MLYNSVRVHINTKEIADAIKDGNKISEEKLQIIKNENYNQMLKDTFHQRVFEAEGIKFLNMTNLHKLMVTKYLLTDLLKETY